MTEVETSCLIKDEASSFTVILEYLSLLSCIPGYTHPSLQISIASCLVPYSLVSGLMSLYKVTLGRHLWKRQFQPSLTVLTPDFFMLLLEKTLDK